MLFLPPPFFFERISTCNLHFGFLCFCKGRGRGGGGGDRASFLF